MRTRISLIALLCLLLFACGGRQPKMPGQLTPDSPEYMFNEGLMLLNAGQLDQAEAKLKAALAKNPKLANVHHALGLVYTYRQEFPKAAACFEKAIELYPRYYDALNVLGMVYTEMGEYDKARANLLIAASAADYATPENAYVNLALLEIKFKKPDSALRYVEKGLLLNSRFAPLFNLRGNLLENEGKLEEALDSFERAADLQPEAAEFTIRCALIMNQLGRKQQALDKIENALGKMKDPEEQKRLLQIMQEIEKK
jgi:protein O-GlcNAc transferase